MEIFCVNGECTNASFVRALTLSCPPRWTVAEAPPLTQPHQRLRTRWVSGSFFFFFVGREARRRACKKRVDKTPFVQHWRRWGLRLTQVCAFEVRLFLISQALRLVSAAFAFVWLGRCFSFSFLFSFCKIGRTETVLGFCLVFSFLSF